MPNAPDAPTGARVGSLRAREDALLFEDYVRTRGQAAREALLLRYMPLARSLAGRYAHGGESEDVQQVAALALLKAIDRYEPEHGRAFSSFAVPTILGEIKRHFRDHGWAVRVPRALQERSLDVSRTAERLTAQLGRSPSPAEVADALGLDVEQVLEALQVGTAHVPDSLDAPAGAADGEPAELAVGVDEPGYATAEVAATLAPLVSTLTDVERTILRLRFHDDLTQTEIGELVGVSQMHVSRLLRAIMAKLHDAAE
jgi:RNA polymerase sigma-B factor